MTAWMPAWVGLGSNLDDPAAHVARALTQLDHVPGSRCLLRSSLYASPPMGPPGQPDYVNAAAGVLTTLSPHALLGALQGIERDHGRIRDGERWGPRTLDLDLLVFGGRVVSDPGLTLPHPGAHERAFVLLPLAELAPGLPIPGRGRVQDLLGDVDAGKVRRLSR